MPTEFKNGRAYHITDAQFAAIRGGKPITPAASRSARPVAAAPKPPAFDGAAFGRADMKRQVAAMTGEAVPRSAAASVSRKNMAAELKRQGMEPVR